MKTSLRTLASFLLLARSAMATFQYTVNHKLGSLCWDGGSDDATTVFSGIACPTDSSKILWQSMKTVDDQGQTVTCSNGYTASWSRSTTSTLWNAAFLGESCGDSPTQYSLPIEVGQTLEEFSHTLEHTIPSLCFGQKPGATAKTVFYGTSCPDDPSNIIWNRMETVDESGVQYCHWNRKADHENFNSWNEDWLGSCGVAPNQVQALPTATLSFENVGDGLCEDSNGMPYRFYEIEYPTSERAAFCSSIDQGPAPYGKSLPHWYLDHTNGGTGQWSNCEALCRADSNCNSWMGRNSGNTCYLSTATELVPCPWGDCSDHHPHTFNALNCDRENHCSSTDQGPTMSLPNWYLDHSNGGSGQWSNCEALCRADSKCNSWMGRNSGNTCYLSTATELVACPSDCSDHHPHTFNAFNCRENYCSSADQGPSMSLPNWYLDHTNGGAGQWSNCEDLCRADSNCNSWMGRNSGNTCYLSTATALVACPWGDCSDHHPHTLNAANCGSIWSADEKVCGKKCLHDSNFHQQSFTGVEVEPVVDFVAMTIQAECRCLFDHTLHPNPMALSSTGSGSGMVSGSTGSISGAENSVCYQEMNF